jgi:tyrosine-specific transport protein
VLNISNSIGTFSDVLAHNLLRAAAKSHPNFSHNNDATRPVLSSTMMLNCFVLIGLLLSSNQGAAFTLYHPSTTMSPPCTSTTHATRSTRLHMMQPTLDSEEPPRRRKPELRALAIDTMRGSDKSEGDDMLSFDFPTPSSSSGVWQVLSAASLVTGSTVGASMLVLPSLAAGPGLALSTGMFFGIYLLVLTSGLVIADVAIHQHESGYEVPSSFQEFAEANLGDNEWTAKFISVIPIVVNSLVMIFDIGKAGEIGAAMAPSLGMDPMVGSFGFVGILGACLSTLSGSNLSTVASMCVSALLLSFGGLLVPGLVGVQDPMATITAAGTAGDEWMASMVSAAPIVLTALQFQNVVPSLAKILKFDRTMTVAAIALGSFTPLLMYLAWTYAVLGGGIDTSGVAGPLFSIFSASAVTGSAIGAGMSVTEEVETTLLKARSSEEEATGVKSEIFSLPAVLIALGVPMVGVLAWDDATAALGLAGSFGSPILYGVIPALMAWNQRQKTTVETKPLVPGGLASVGALGLAASVYVGEGLAQQVTHILS